MIRGMTPLLLLCLVLVGGERPNEESGRLPVLKAGDTAAVLEHVGQRIYVVGTVERAAWSRSGKVMNIVFEEAGDNGVMAVVFDGQRKQFDEGFGGDAAEFFTGKRLRLQGEVTMYGGQVEAMKGRPEIVLRYASQIVVPAE
jgi:hypothetical protein